MVGKILFISFSKKKKSTINLKNIIYDFKVVVMGQYFWAP